MPQPRAKSAGAGSKRAKRCPAAETIHPDSCQGPLFQLCILQPSGPGIFGNSGPTLLQCPRPLGSRNKVIRLPSTVYVLCYHAQGTWRDWEVVLQDRSTMGARLRTAPGKTRGVLLLLATAANCTRCCTPMPLQNLVCSRFCQRLFIPRPSLSPSPERALHVRKLPEQPKNSTV